MSDDGDYSDVYSLIKLLYGSDLDFDPLILFLAEIGRVNIHVLIKRKTVKLLSFRQTDRRQYIMLPTLITRNSHEMSSWSNCVNIDSYSVYNSLDVVMFLRLWSAC